MALRIRRSAEDSANYCTAIELRERGWTPALIKKYLGKPDTSTRNTTYRSAPDIKMYSWIRVEECEQSEEWQCEIAALRARTDAAKSQQKRKKLLEQVEEMQVVVSHLSPRELVPRAIVAYNEYHQERMWQYGYQYAPAHAGCDKRFLQRIAVNYIRHELTHYDEVIERLSQAPAMAQARNAIRRRIYYEIIKVYPQYTDECLRQQAFREE